MSRVHLLQEDPMGQLGNGVSEARPAKLIDTYLEGDC